MLGCICIVLVLCGCGEKTTENVTNEVAIASFFHDNNMAVCPGVYVVGRDLKEANYIIANLDSNQMSELVLFDTLDEYKAYFQSPRFSIGEESDAVKAHASKHLFLPDSDSAGLNVYDGNVLLMKYGIAQLTFANTELTPAVSTPSITVGRSMYPETFVIGKDINEGSYIYTTTGDNGAYVIVFESKEKYDEFNSLNHPSAGEFQKDIEKYAFCERYISSGEQYYVCLQEGMVLLVSGYKSEGTLQGIALGWMK